MKYIDVSIGSYYHEHVAYLECPDDCIAEIDKVSITGKPYKVHVLTEFGEKYFKEHDVLKKYGWDPTDYEHYSIKVLNKAQTRKAIKDLEAELMKLTSDFKVLKRALVNFHTQEKAN